MKSGRERAELPAAGFWFGALQRVAVPADIRPRPPFRILKQLGTFTVANPDVGSSGVCYSLNDKFLGMKACLFLAAILLATTGLFGQVKNAIDDGRKIKVPIVFHVIYNNNEENVSDSLILSELQDLNLTFAQKNNMDLLDNDFRALVGNPNIEFYLLDTAFQASGLAGVRRTQRRDLVNKDKLLVKPATCVNVFIAKQGNASDILSDKIDLDYEDVGMHSGVLTHETGHWMGLYHIFGQIGNSYWWSVAFGNRDDLIGDTPEQKGATATCYKISDRCPCPPRDIYYKGHKTMYNNFMDYNPCRCMFTIGQAIQMRNNIIEHKRTLFDSSR